MKEGPEGGSLRVLSEGDVETIHDSSLRILEDCGVQCESAAILGVFARGGARVEADGGRVRIPRSLVQWALGSAPRSFVLCGRDPALDLLLEQRRVYYGMGGTSYPFFWDHGHQVLRPSVAADVAVAARVGQALPHVDFVMSLAAAGDVPEHLHYLYEYHAILRHTTKPVVYCAPSREDAVALLELAAAASGGEAELRRRPSVMLYTQPVSPLRIGAYQEAMIEFAAWGAPILYSPNPIMGASAPATLAGALVQGHAENLAGVVLAQLLRPGTPVVYGPHTPVMDMTTMVSTYAAIEQILTRAAMAQLARRCGLPSFSAGGGCEAKVVDAQAGAEAALGILVNALAGLTLTQTLGTMGSGTFGSLEMLVIGDEIVAMVKRLLQGIDVSEETLGVEVIAAVGPGGHFLDLDHTLRLFRSQFLFPRLFDRRRLPEWQAQGEPRIEEAARARLSQILAQPQAGLPTAVEQALDECLAKHCR